MDEDERALAQAIRDRSKVIKKEVSPPKSVLCCASRRLWRSRCVARAGRFFLEEFRRSTLAKDGTNLGALVAFGLNSIRRLSGRAGGGAAAGVSGCSRRPRSDRENTTELFPRVVVFACRPPARRQHYPPPHDRLLEIL